MNLESAGRNTLDWRFTGLGAQPFDLCFEAARVDAANGDVEPVHHVRLRLVDGSTPQLYLYDRQPWDVFLIEESSTT